MKNFPTKEEVKQIKEQYPVGTVVELKEMQDPYNPVPSGTRGVVTGIDDSGSLIMKWNNGRTLSLIVGEDEFDVITHNTVINQDFKGSMTAWIAQKQGDVGEKLILPNTYEKIVETAERINQNPENCYVYDSYTKTGTALLKDEHTQNINLFELNFLARKLEDLEEIEMFGFDGMIENMDESQDLSSLINLAMNCKDMQGVDVSPATTDEELGEFYIDAGIIEEVQKIPYEFREWVIEHLDAQKIGEDIRENENAFIYCDPPYYAAEGFYSYIFTYDDHVRLRDTLVNAKGYVMVSYNNHEIIKNLYKDFYIYYTTRPNSMSKKEGDLYEELIMTNYDPCEHGNPTEIQLNLFGEEIQEFGNYELIHKPEKPLKN